MGSVSDVYSEHQIHRLKTILNVKDESEFPSVYGEIANTTKRTIHQIVQDNVDILAMKNRRYPFAVQVGHGGDFRTLRFHGVDRDDLSSGIGVMTVVPPVLGSDTVRSLKSAISLNAKMSNMLSCTKIVMSIMDLKEINKTKVFIPTDYWESISQIESFEYLLGTILGTAHHQYLAYCKCLKFVADNRGKFECMFTKPNSMEKNWVPPCYHSLSIMHNRIGSRISFTWTSPSDLSNFLTV